MARYIGPSCKRARREGVDLMLKSGVRPFDTKCKPGTSPGQHGAKKARGTDYSLQLRAKQKLKRIYGLLEKQFRNCYVKASAQKGATGENLLKLLERRLDNVVYRIGFASTRAEARQLVSHKSILVNGHCVNIPSYVVKVGDVIAVREKCRTQARIGAALALSEQKASCDWLTIDQKAFSGIVNGYPEMTDLPADYNIKLVVELYSK